jgi:uncharacterized protein
MKIRNKKRVVQIFLVLFIIALCPVTSFASINHTNDFYVNDYANVLSEETETHILKVAEQLAAETTAQVCVLTVDTIEDADISEYSVEILRDWGIGDSEKNNGVLILLCVEDRNVWVSTGYGVEGTLPDGKLGRFMDTYAVPSYKDDDFDKGTLFLFDAIVNELRTQEYGLEPLDDSEIIHDNSTVGYEVEDTRALGVILIPIALVIGLIVFQDVKYLYLKKLDRKNGTNLAPIYRIKCHEVRSNLLHIVLFLFLRGGRGGGGHGGNSSGNRGGGGSTGGGGAGRSF